MKEGLTEKEIASQLETMRENAILELHEWQSTKGHGFLINPDGSIYDYSWFLGFNEKDNQFGMCTSLDKRKDNIDCNAVKNYLQNELQIFDAEYDNNFEHDGGCDIIVKFDEKNRYSNNIKLYKKIYDKINAMF